MNQWIQFVSKTDAAFADPFSMAGKINQTQGEFLVGDYPSTTRKGLLDLYRDTKVFTFDDKKGYDGNLDDKSTLKYTVAVNQDALVKVNKKAEEKLKLKPTYTKDQAGTKTLPAGLTSSHTEF